MTWEYQTSTLKVLTSSGDMTFNSRETDLFAELDADDWEVFSVVVVDGLVRYYSKRLQNTGTLGNMNIKVTDVPEKSAAEINRLLLVERLKAKGGSDVRG